MGNKNLIITIEREYGSGGREIGERLASELGIAYCETVWKRRTYCGTQAGRGAGASFL